MADWLGWKGRSRLNTCVTGGGAWVVYDPYWDPVSSHATQAEAEAKATKMGCHVIFDPEGTPGLLRGDNYGHWDGFMAQFPQPPETG